MIKVTKQVKDTLTLLTTLPQFSCQISRILFSDKSYKYLLILTEQFEYVQISEDEAKLFSNGKTGGYFDEKHHRRYL